MSVAILFAHVAIAGCTNHVGSSIFTTTRKVYYAEVCDVLLSGKRTPSRSDSDGVILNRERIEKGKDLQLSKRTTLRLILRTSKVNGDLVDVCATVLVSNATMQSPKMATASVSTVALKEADFVAVAIANPVTFMYMEQTKRKVTHRDALLALRVNLRRRLCRAKMTLWVTSTQIVLRLILSESPLMRAVVRRRLKKKIFLQSVIAGYVALLTAYAQPIHARQSKEKS